jgi:hypothetical protein
MTGPLVSSREAMIAVAAAAALFVAVMLGSWGVLTLIDPPQQPIEVQLGCVIEHDIMPEDLGREQQLCR